MSEEDDKDKGSKDYTVAHVMLDLRPALLQTCLALYFEKFIDETAPDMYKICSHNDCCSYYELSLLLSKINEIYGD
jgi:hypothetical protein